jgi:isoleucyl-tRNA synthetase
MLRWMAPFLSFTAEEAWKVFAPSADPATQTLFTETWWDFGAAGAGQPALLDKWAQIRGVREAVNKRVEAVRSEGRLGSSLQAEVRIGVPPGDAAVQALRSLDDALKFVLITSQARVEDAPDLRVDVQPSTAPKCERCWHYRDDVGRDPAHPTICGRCTSNLYGPGEVRTIA